MCTIIANVASAEKKNCCYLGDARRREVAADDEVSINLMSHSPDESST
jgi:hypothetical protein